MDFFWNMPNASIVLAALSGLTFLAYNHPAAYQRLAALIFAAIFLIGLAFWIWDAGSMHAYKSVEPLIVAAKAPLAQSVVQANIFPIYSFALNCGFVVAYLGFLWYLPKFLK